MTYYLGGYYLARLRPVPTSLGLPRLVYTASECLNDSLIEAWAFSNTNDKEIEEIKRDLNLDDDQITAIRAWCARKLSEKRLGWVNVFASAEDAKEYGDMFFPDMPDVVIFALYVEESQATTLQFEFKPDPGQGEIGLVQTLSKRIAESDKGDEKHIGFDLIGVECGGNFHTFHCNDLGAELSEKFGLRLNDLGLFESHENWTAVLGFLNEEGNGCEPVPWFVAKLKIVNPNLVS